MDSLTKDKRSWNMSRVKSRDTKLEIVFRKELWKNNIRYRKNVSNMKGKPDLVFKKCRTVLYIDSCFWHKCTLHSHIPKTNIKFWKNKLENNKKRDKVINKYYISQGWRVIRIWEHDLEKQFNKKVKYVIKLLSL